MKQYDLITIGTGSAMNIVDAMIQENPNIRVAVIDKDEPGGICLTRGCIPSKILLYPAELVRTIEKARELGVDAKIANINFQTVMERMRTLIYRDIDQIREGLSSSKNIDYYHAPAEFISPYTLRVDGTEITSKMIFLCIGSKINIPSIKGLDKIKYHTSDTVLKLTKLPESIAIVGGGYIAAEYGHFFSSMGSKVVIIGRNPQFLPDEEPEVSALAKKDLERHITILTNQEVREAREIGDQKELIAVDRKSGKTSTIAAKEIMVATGRGPITDILHPEKAGIELTKEGWIEVNEYLETTQPNIWALGDADGKYPFKHVANYESKIVYYNAILKKKVKADYHAIPHAVFTYPEIASVGLGEKEAVETYGPDKVLIGFQKYEDTAKGEAMNVKEYFVKVIVEAETTRILGAHIIGPYASILIHEIIPIMYAGNGSYEPISDSIHIHPALSEVVDRAFQSLVPAEHYQHMKQHSHELVTA
ncbi:MAG: dihydrolipoyl dehydrogenase [Crenarchaeota archaeon 13_1_40CM_2_52_14]|nr:MAG: dihydrolipoyl dehydrogenase [Crenarchaeota archaeon 13_1_40CM_3_52_17]OLD34128.1 MAG: dihydrolipoyl dehydrogenase [Crenarchaeota archaeon 13_1_40CM_2_52_14]